MAKPITSFGAIFQEDPNELGQSAYRLLIDHASDVLDAKWGLALASSDPLSRGELELLAAEFKEVQEWASAIQLRIAEIMDEQSRAKEISKQRTRNKKIKKKNVTSR